MDTALIAVLNTFKITLFHILNTKVQARKPGGRSYPYEFFRPPWKNVLGVVSKYWT